jgi:hypothetical protein
MAEFELGSNALIIVTDKHMIADPYLTESATRHPIGNLLV